MIMHLWITSNQHTIITVNGIPLVQLTKNDMFAIQKITRSARDKKLATIGITATICLSKNRRINPSRNVIEGIQRILSLTDLETS